METNPFNLAVFIEELLALTSVKNNSEIYSKFILLVCYIILCYRAVIKLAYDIGIVIEKEKFIMYHLYIPPYFIWENFSDLDNTIFRNMTKVYVMNYKNCELFDEAGEMEGRYEINQKSFLKGVLDLINNPDNPTAKNLIDMLHQFIQILENDIPTTSQHFKTKGGIDLYTTHLFKCVDDVLLSKEKEGHKKLFRITQLFRENFS